MSKRLKWKCNSQFPSYDAGIIANRSYTRLHMTFRKLQNPHCCDEAGPDTHLSVILFLVVVTRTFEFICAFRIIAATFNMCKSGRESLKLFKCQDAAVL